MACAPLGRYLDLVVEDPTELKTRLALAEREANARAAAAGEPLPFPNPWDAWDPTKVARDATPAQIHQSYLAFRKRCRLPLKRHTI